MPTLESAARLVGQRDHHILENDLRKEAIAHRLAHYLEEILFKDEHLDLEGFSVDCEYNSGAGYRRKHLHTQLPKRSKLQLPKRDQHIRPDVIVHQRRPDGINLLMVEVKKSSTISLAAQKFSLLKCEAFREFGLQYLFAGYVCFRTGESLRGHGNPWTELRRLPET